MELDELEIRDCRTGAVRHPDPVSDSSERIRRPFPERSGAAGREQYGPSRDVAACRHDSDATAAADPELERELVLADLDPRLREDRRGEGARDPLPRCGAVDAEDA
jgi:hypothetical protein